MVHVPYFLKTFFHFRDLFLRLHEGKFDPVATDLNPLIAGVYTDLTLATCLLASKQGNYHF